MRVLVIAPHPDDESIGCGGVLCQHARRKDEVSAIFLTSGELGLKHLSPKQAWEIREQEARAAANILGITNLSFLRYPDWSISDLSQNVANTLHPLLSAGQPEIIYVPHEKEWHPDHKAALPILKLALSELRLTFPEIRAYEVWTPLTEFDLVEDITPVMRRKMQAVRAHASQLTEFNYERGVRGLNAFRGAMAAKSGYAEVYQRISLETSR